MIKVYETIMILKPDGKPKEEIEKYKWLLQDYSLPFKINVEDMGEKGLAYEIAKHETGYYCVFIWTGTPEALNELERQMRIDDDVMKFITVNTDKELPRLTGAELEEITESINQAKRVNCSHSEQDARMQQPSKN